ncbi:hypothetical protein RRG08_018748 [Elysia crispata]|uniref:Uncharacterized protein n=1 Tax=Elysia crispata TaxID=231223 RepID=A0AAE0Z5I4_9GAST|nr:hypothetical protein RRG08_018748 [Elysia crispata]
MILIESGEVLIYIDLRLPCFYSPGLSEVHGQRQSGVIRHQKHKEETNKFYDKYLLPVPVMVNPMTSSLGDPVRGSADLTRSVSRLIDEHFCGVTCLYCERGRQKRDDGRLKPF